MYVTRSYDTFDKEVWTYPTPADMGDKEYPDEIAFLDRDGNPALARHFDDERWQVWWDQDLYEDFVPETLTVRNLVGEVRCMSIMEDALKYNTSFDRMRARDGSLIQTWFDPSGYSQCWLVWS